MNYTEVHTVWVIKRYYKKQASLIAQLVKNLPAMQETPVRFLDQKDRCRRDRLPTPVFLGFPCDSVGKGSTCIAGDPNLKVHRDTSSISGSGRSPRGGNGNLL